MFLTGFIKKKKKLKCGFWLLLVDLSVNMWPTAVHAQSRHYQFPTSLPAFNRNT